MALSPFGAKQPALERVSDRGRASPLRGSPARRREDGPVMPGVRHFPQDRLQDSQPLQRPGYRWPDRSIPPATTSCNNRRSSTPSSMTTTTNGNTRRWPCIRPPRSTSPQAAATAASASWNTCSMTRSSPSHAAGAFAKTARRSISAACSPARTWASSRSSTASG